MNLEEVVQELKNTRVPRDCLQRAYVILTEKYHGGRIETYSHIYKLFKRNPEKLWKKSGFLHCTNLNILLKTLLIGSKHFSDEDIRFKWTQIWYCSPHQYAQVRIGDRWIDIDIWAHRYGIKFGDHAHGFH